MKKFTLLTTMLLTFLTWSFGQDLVITSAFDCTLTGGTPKGVELYVVNDIADLSIYGIGSANNGGGSDGEEFTFPADSYTAGDFIYVASESPQFVAWFGFTPNYLTSAMGINGDDAVELFKNGAVTDVFGDINVDGNGEPWEYLDGWAYRVSNTGPDGSSFVLGSWTFSGANALDGETSNATAASPVPIGTYTSGGPAAVAAPTFTPAAGTYYSTQNVTLACATPGVDIYYTTNGTDPNNTSTLYAAPINVASTTTIKAIAIDPTATLADSPITTGVYTISSSVIIPDLATLRTQATDGTIYTLTSEAVVTFTQSYRNQKFAQDGTAGILIDDNSGNFTTSYAVGDGITGITGTLTTYSGMLQFVPQTDAGAATSTGNTVSPAVVSATDFVNNFESYEGQLVKLINLTFADAGANFANGQVYAATDGNGAALNFRTSFYSVDYIGTPIPAGENVVVGIANDRNNPYLTARDAADFSPYAPVIPLNSMGIIIAGLLLAAVVVIRKGRLF